MNLIPYIHTSFATPFLHYLLENGYPAQKHLHMAKLPESLLEQIDGYVSEHYIYQLLNIAAHREDIEDFGLQAAKPVSVAALGELGEQMAAMPTLYASLDLFCRKICGEVISHIGFWLTRHDGKTWFFRTTPPGFDHDLKHPEQFTILFMIKLIRMFTGAKWRPKKVWLRSNNKSDFIDHPDFKNTEFLSGKNIAAIALPSLSEENSIVQNRLTPPGIITVDTNQSLRRLLKMYLPKNYPGIEIELI